MITTGLRKIQGILKNPLPDIKGFFEKKKNERLKKVEIGAMTEDLIISKVWQEVLDPWIEGEKHSARLALENHNSRYPKDEYGFYPTGRIHVLTEFKAFLKSNIEKAQTARKELELLYKTKEQDNAH